MLSIVALAACGDKGLLEPVATPTPESAEARCMRVASHSHNYAPRAEIYEGCMLREAPAEANEPEPSRDDLYTMPPCDGLKPGDFWRAEIMKGGYHELTACVGGTMETMN